MSEHEKSPDASESSELPKDFGVLLRAAVRNHCWLTKPQHWGEEEVDNHRRACLADLREEPREDWMWWLGYFGG